MADAAQPTEIRGLRILIVEDEYLIAVDLRADLESRGAVVVGPAATVEEALDLVGRSGAIDAAILDVNLRGEPVYPVAETLQRHGVPFVFVTGYDRLALPDDYADIARHEKPIDVEKVSRALIGRA